MTEFHLSTESRETEGGNIQIVAIKGALDAHTFPRFQSCLEGITEDRGKDPRLVLDCENLDYISSAGLGVLKKMVREMRVRGGDIRLASLSGKIRNIVQLLGFTKLIKIYPTLQEAVDSYRK
jgi:anti-sigma B factor antagonist